MHRSDAATPAQRWHDATRSRPLEPARALPAGLTAWARAVSGRTAPRWTSGPATTAALGAAGALGASSGDVVHLPAPPAADRPPSRVLAHELAHLRQSLARPRFLLARAAGAPDADERSAAAAVGALQRVGGSLSSRPDALSPASAGIVQGLPVASGGAGMVEVAQTIARQVVAEAVGGAGAPGAAVGATGAGGTGVGGTGVGGTLRDAATAVGPGGGYGGWTAPTIPGAGPWGSDAGSLAAGPTGGATGTGRAPQADALAGQPPGSPGTGSPGGAGAAGAGTTGLPESVVDGLVDALEQRLVAELERRGGRYTGVF